MQILVRRISEIVFQNGNVTSLFITCSDVAVKGVLRSSFLNSGQICLCSSRIYVHKSLQEEFLKRFKTSVESLKV